MGKDSTSVARSTLRVWRLIARMVSSLVIKDVDLTRNPDAFGLQRCADAFAQICIPSISLPDRAALKQEIDLMLHGCSLFQSGFFERFSR